MNKKKRFYLIRRKSRSFEVFTGTKYRAARRRCIIAEDDGKH
jgi:hypothetical protein